MTLLVPWKRYQPDETPPACPRCGTVPEDPYLSIRHEVEPFADRYPAWIHCRTCRDRLPESERNTDAGLRRCQYAAGIYTMRRRSQPWSIEGDDDS